MKPEYTACPAVYHGTPLAQWVQDGTLTQLDPCSWRQRPACSSTSDSEGSVFRANHASNYLILKGTLNRDKAALLKRSTPRWRASSPSAGLWNLALKPIAHPQSLRCERSALRSVGEKPAPGAACFGRLWRLSAGFVFLFRQPCSRFNCGPPACAAETRRSFAPVLVPPKTPPALPSRSRPRPQATRPAEARHGC